MKKLTVYISVLATVSLLFTGCNRPANRELEVNTNEKTTITPSNDKESNTGNGIYGEIIKDTDIVIKDTLYNGMINDIVLNWGDYEGKSISIEGFQIVNGDYTFIGRYSNVACSCCPQGYSYMEYEWDGEKIDLSPETEWLSITGILKKGYDEPQDKSTFFYYIEASSIEVKKEWGMATVNN